MCYNWCKKRMSSSLDDLKNPFFWRGVAAEGLGTMFLVLIATGSCLGKDWESDNYAPTQLQISLCFGLAVATMVWCIAHLSGGHINPAVTVGMLLTRKISLARAIIFIVVQCVGAIVGSAILDGLTPEDDEGDLCMTKVNGDVTAEQAFGVELLITFVLVLTVFASSDSNRKDLNGSAPLTIGLSVTVCHLFAIKYSGSSMNPARSFGPAVVTGFWKDHWVYWCGPILGGVLAAILYETIFAADASLAKAKYFLLSTKSEDDPSRNAAKTPEERDKMREAEERL